MCNMIINTVSFLCFTKPQTTLFWAVTSIWLLLYSFFIYTYCLSCVIIILNNMLCESYADITNYVHPNVNLVSTVTR